MDDLFNDDEDSPATETSAMTAGDAGGGGDKDMVSESLSLSGDSDGHLMQSAGSVRTRSAAADNSG